MKITEARQILHNHIWGHGGIDAWKVRAAAAVVLSAVDIAHAAYSSDDVSDLNLISYINTNDEEYRAKYTHPPESFMDQDDIGYDPNAAQLEAQFLIYKVREVFVNGGPKGKHTARAIEVAKHLVQTGSLEEVACIMCVTRERIRQIVDKFLRKERPASLPVDTNDQDPVS